MDDGTGAAAAAAGAGAVLSSDDVRLSIPQSSNRGTAWCTQVVLIWCDVFGMEYGFINSNNGDINVSLSNWCF